MNPLPRSLATALFVVLAILVAVLAVPIRRGSQNRNPLPSEAVAATSTPAPAAAPGAEKVIALSQRAALILAGIGAALAVALLFSLAWRTSSAGDTAAPLAAARQEFGALAKLAENSAAQGAELSRERDVRRRAEEDAQLKQQLLAQSVEEKIRLGQDLHDGIIQSLYAVGLTLETMRPLLHADPAQAERRLDDVRTNLNAAIRDVRAYISGLAPENLRRASFSRSVTLLFDQLRAGREAQFDINIDDDAAGRLSLEQNVEALQIAREAISNALRHGEATQITLRMHQGDGAISLLVQDNGRGFDPQQRRDGGHGLGNMQARAQRLGATVRITSQPGQGARVVATFPVSELPAT